MVNSTDDQIVELVLPANKHVLFSVISRILFSENKNVMISENDFEKKFHKVKQCLYICV